LTVYLKADILYDESEMLVIQEFYLPKAVSFQSQNNNKKRKYET